MREWNRGKVHEIRKSVFHLISGEIFEIDGKKFFVMGGASSHDREWRIEGVSWWPEEIPSRDTLEYGLENLKRDGNRVDYIISHCAPSKIQREISPYYKEDILTDYLDYIYENIEFDKWFCGHYHTDEWINEKFRILYHEIISI